MQVERVADPGAEWDAFVEATPGAALGHAAAWHRVLREAYGLAPEYLRGARTPAAGLAGMLPLVPFRTLRGALELVSLPFLDTAGRARAPRRRGSGAARRRARASARDRRASRSSCASATPLAAGPPPGALQPRRPRAPARGERGSAVEGAPREGPQPDAQGRARGPRARRGPARGPAERASTRRSCVNMRDLGSPVHARRFFGAAAAAFGARLRFVIAALGRATRRRSRGDPLRRRGDGPLGLDAARRARSAARTT